MLSNSTLDSFVHFVRGWYDTEDFIPLHAPVFGQREKDYVVDTIESTFVSSVGEYVKKFEDTVATYTGSSHAVATVNGTAALHIALQMIGVMQNDLVITQAMTFAATCAAIRYCGADPAFVDIDSDTLGMSSTSLEDFLTNQCEMREQVCVHSESSRPIRACVPMHTFGHPARTDEIILVCSRFNILVVEDAAEALGSYRNGRHAGTQGSINTLSFNGNKIITTGGGGMLLFKCEKKAALARHLTTTAKKLHQWHYDHDLVGYNYRLPNLNAALGCAQMESLENFLKSKRRLAIAYLEWCDASGVEWVAEPEGCQSNYWLMAIRLDNQSDRDEFLDYTNSRGVMTRPAWTPMHMLDMYRNSHGTRLPETEDAFRRIVNIPSSALQSSKQ